MATHQSIETALDLLEQEVQLALALATSYDDLHADLDSAQSRHRQHNWVFPVRRAAENVQSAFDRLEHEIRTQALPLMRDFDRAHEATTGKAGR